MNRFQPRVVVVFLAVALATSRAEDVFPTSPNLQKIVAGAVAETLLEFSKSKLQSNQVAVTMVDLTQPRHAARASFRGDVPIYPASVIKLFYLVAAHRWMEDGKVEDTAELRRAMRDMIVDSGNDPTHYI